MYVDYCGWTEERGSFRHKVFVDENRTDYAVHFANGMVARQNSVFQIVVADWNHDQDVYPQYGAWFEYRDADGKFNGGEFFTPEDLVRFAADARDPHASSFGPRPLKVEGIEIPTVQRNDLFDRIDQAEKRAMQQEAERNRKMDQLGIRRPNEPWAR